MIEIGTLDTRLDTLITESPYFVGVDGDVGNGGIAGPRGPIGPAGLTGLPGDSAENIAAQDAFKDLLQNPPVIDIDFGDGIYASKRGPLPTFSRNTSGTFMNSDGVLVGKTTSSTSINLSTTTVGSTISVTIPSRAAVDWQLGSTVLLLSDSDADNQIDVGESYISCTLLDYTLSTNTLSLRVDSISGSTTISSWAVGYCGPRLDCVSIPKSSNNILSNSENFTSVWIGSTFSPFGTNPTTNSIANAIISPDNAFNGTKITEISSNAAGYTILRQSLPLAESSRTHTFSVYAKYGNLRYLALHSFFNNGGVENAATFDLLTGSVGSSTRGTVTRTMTAVGDDWYRCSITFKTPSSITSNFVDIRFHDADLINTTITTRNYRYTYVYGAQLEIGSVATPYVKRLGFFETRNECAGVLIEESRTNRVRNNMMVGAVTGDPGTAPTNWSISNSGTGITRQIVGTGIENGIPYIDVRTYGTTTGILYFGIRTDSNTQIAALNGQTWTSSFYTRLTGGTFTNITRLLHVIQYSNASGTALTYNSGSIVPTSASLNSQRFIHTATASDASTAFVSQYLQLEANSGAVIDITLRVGMPQLELGESATSVIPTTTSPAIRATDDIIYNGETLSNLWNRSEGTIVCEFDTAGKSAYNGTYFDDSFVFQAATDQSNRIGVLTDGSGNLSPEMIAAGVDQYVPIIKKYIENSVQRVAVSFKSGAPTRAYLSGSPYVNDTNINATLPAITTLALGKSEASSNYLNGHLRVFKYYDKYFSENTLKFLTTTYDGSVRDQDASLYIEKVNGILQGEQGTLNDVISESQRDAINRFVVSGKRSGWWWRIKHLYLPIWGSAAANSVNLIDCSSGEFVGGFTHSSGWSTGNGTTGRFDYGTSPSAVGLSPTSGCIFFLLPNTIPLLSSMGTTAAVMGCADSGSTNAMSVSKSGSSLSYVYGGTTATSFTYAAGVHLIKRESPNGVVYQTRRSTFEDLVLGPTASSTGISSANMNAWAFNNNGTVNNYGLYNIGLHGMGLGLSNADGSKFITDCENLWESCTSYTL